MAEPMSDCTNDLSGAKDPDITSVAICVGTDIDGCPVTLVDRACLNRPAAEALNDNYSIALQEAKVFRSEAEICGRELTAAENANVGSVIISIVLAVALGIALLTRKN